MMMMIHSVLYPSIKGRVKALYKNKNRNNNDNNGSWSESKVVVTGSVRLAPYVEKVNAISSDVDCSLTLHRIHEKAMKFASENS